MTMMRNSEDIALIDMEMIKNADVEMIKIPSKFDSDVDEDL